MDVRGAGHRDVGHVKACCPDKPVDLTQLKANTWSFCTLSVEPWMATGRATGTLVTQKLVAPINL
ncbi:MAG: hypothetical protein ACI8WB_003259 [Phenylobacterium sp.]|jgi:hypothetical protein